MCLECFQCQIFGIYVSGGGWKIEFSIWNIKRAISGRYKNEILYLFKLKYMDRKLMKNLTNMYKKLKFYL